MSAPFHVVICSPTAPPVGELLTLEGCPVGSSAYLVESLLLDPSTVLWDSGAFDPAQIEALVDQVHVVFAIGALAPVAFYAFGAAIGAVFGVLHRFRL